MSNQHRATKAGQNTPANDKAPGVDAAQGQENTRFNCTNFKQTTWKRQFDALNAAGILRISVGLVVDLETYPVSHVRTLIQNKDALNLLSLAAAGRFRYAVVAGPLLKKDGGAFGAVLHEAGIAEALPNVVMLARTRMVELGDHATVWDFMVDDSLLERLKSAAGGAA